MAFKPLIAALVCSLQMAGAVRAQQLDWAVEFRGTHSNLFSALASDASGNILVAGYFEDSIDFDPGPATLTLFSGTASDAFVVKLDAAGGLVWAARFDGPLASMCKDIAVDGAGTILCVGNFRGTIDFDPGPGVFSLTSQGGLDAFAVKLSPSGALVWAVQFGSVNDDGAESIGLDPWGNLDIGGQYGGLIDMDPGPGTYSLSASSQNVFLLELDATAQFQWAFSISGLFADNAGGLKVDPAGNIHFTGLLNGTADMDPGPGVFNILGNGVVGDNFIAKYDDSGGFQWAGIISNNSGQLYANPIDVDAAGNVYFKEILDGIVDVDMGPDTFLLSTYTSDFYISEYDANGQFLGVLQNNAANASGFLTLQVRPDGSIYDAGYFADTIDIDPGPDTLLLFPVGSWPWNAFVRKLDPSGDLVWAAQFTCDYAIQMIDLIVDPSGRIVASGHYSGIADLDPGSGTFLMSSGYYDLFVLSLSELTAEVEEGGPWSDQQVMLYPVPSSGTLHVDLDPGLAGGAYNVLDAAGRVVRKGTIPGNEFRLELEGIASGQYWFEAGTSDLRLVRPFVIH